MDMNRETQNFDLYTKIKNSIENSLNKKNKNLLDFKEWAKDIQNCYENFQNIANSLTRGESERLRKKILEFQSQFSVQFKAYIEESKNTLQDMPEAQRQNELTYIREADHVLAEIRNGWGQEAKRLAQEMQHVRPLSRFEKIRAYFGYPSRRDIYIQMTKQYLAGVQNLLQSIADLEWQKIPAKPGSMPAHVTHTVPVNRGSLSADAASIAQKNQQQVGPSSRASLKQQGD